MIDLSSCGTDWRYVNMWYLFLGFSNWRPWCTEVVPIGPEEKGDTDEKDDTLLRQVALATAVCFVSSGSFPHVADRRIFHPKHLGSILCVDKWFWGFNFCAISKAENVFWWHPWWRPTKHAAGSLFFFCHFYVSLPSVCHDYIYIYCLSQEPSAKACSLVVCWSAEQAWLGLKATEWSAACSLIVFTQSQAYVQVAVLAIVRMIRKMRVNHCKNSPVLRTSPVSWFVCDSGPSLFVAGGHRTRWMRLHLYLLPLKDG